MQLTLGAADATLNFSPGWTAHPQLGRTAEDITWSPKS